MRANRVARRPEPGVGTEQKSPLAACPELDPERMRSEKQLTEGSRLEIPAAICL